MARPSLLGGKVRFMGDNEHGEGEAAVGDKPPVEEGPPVTMFTVGGRNDGPEGMAALTALQNMGGAPVREKGAAAYDPESEDKTEWHNDVAALGNPRNGVEVLLRCGEAVVIEEPRTEAFLQMLPPGEEIWSVVQEISAELVPMGDAVVDTYGVILSKANLGRVCVKAGTALCKILDTLTGKEPGWMAINTYPSELITLVETALQVLPLEVWGQAFMTAVGMTMGAMESNPASASDSTAASSGG